jgi:sugar fermentation stimulation protein A
MKDRFAPIVVAGKLKDGILLRREKKFLGMVLLGSRTASAFVPHTGKLDGVLEPQSRVIVAERMVPGRKLNYDVVAVRVGSNWVVVDTRLANKLVEANLEKKSLKMVGAFKTFRNEETIGESRFDFVLRNEKTHILEVKSCTRVVGRTATFPDTISKRSTRQVKQLADLKRSGYKCTLMFVAMRPDVDSFEPDNDRDPSFAHALGSAALEGVKVVAVSTFFDPPLLGIRRSIKVRL